MKKIMVVLSLLMLAVSFQANAASLSWVSTPATSTSGGSPSVLTGDSNSIAANTQVSDTWEFSLDADQGVNLTVVGLPSWISSVTFSGGSLGFTSVAPHADIWTFSGLLAAGNYTISILGTTFQPSSYSLLVETPIPAAVWLFGSALLGVMGVSRRKQA